MHPLSASQSASGPESLAGKLLVAMPGIGDPRFERAVILVCAHGSDHAMGVRLDQPVGDATLGDLLTKLGVGGAPRDPDQAVLAGGPVERERGFVLHTADAWVEGSTLKVADSLALTATREILEVLGTPDAPSRSVLALGYAGWGAGQLEAELKENVWLTAPPDFALVFDDDHETKWERALALMGVRAEMLSGQAGRA